jgi:hypothetical protein
MSEKELIKEFVNKLKFYYGYDFGDAEAFEKLIQEYIEKEEKLGFEKEMSEKGIKLNPEALEKRIRDLEHNTVSNEIYNNNYLNIKKIISELEEKLLTFQTKYPYTTAFENSRKIAELKEIMLEFFYKHGFNYYIEKLGGEIEMRERDENDLPITEL